MSAPGRTPSLLDSFNYAFEGIIHVLRTQRNLRLHFLAAVVVLVAALYVDISKIELIISCSVRSRTPCAWPVSINARI